MALVAAVLLCVADFSQISYRTIGIGACSDRVDPGVCRTYGHDSHSYVLVVVGLVALLMSWGAVVGRARAASIAVAALGVVVLFIALAVDLPKLDDKRGLEVRYNDVSAHTGSAFKLELTGGVLLLLVGGLALVRSGSPEAAPWQPSGRLRARLGRGGSPDAAADDGDPVSSREARARERERRRAARAARSAAPAAAAEPAPITAPPAEGSPPAPAPEGSAPALAPGGSADPAQDPSPDGSAPSPVPDPPPEGSAPSPPTEGSAPDPAPGGPTAPAPDPSPDGSAPSPQTEGSAPDPQTEGSAPSPQTEGSAPEPGEPAAELGPEAYGGHAPESDPPARG